MLRLRRILPVLFAFAALLAPAAASADYNPLGFHFTSAALFVHERDKVAVITVERTDASQAALVAYRTIPLDARAGMDFTSVNGQFNFQVGQSSATFRVPIVDHGMPLPPRTLSLRLFGGWPTLLGTPSHAVLTIVNDDTPQPIARIAGNPLGLLPGPAAGSNPLAGVRFYVNHIWATPAILSRQYRRSHPDWSRALGVIAAQPGVQRFGYWDKPSAAVQVGTYLERASFAEPGTVPMMSTYILVDGICARHQLSDTPADVTRYQNWIDSFASGISDYRAVLFLEMDSLITMPCLSPAGQSVRLDELRYAIDTLIAKCPRLAIYVDAGAADAEAAWQQAALLRRLPVSKIQGFFLNSTHFDWTLHEINYGEQISRLTGGAHFVVNTGDSGTGPLKPPNVAKDGNEVLCNPPGRGLGPRPTWKTGYPNVDAFAWISDPGESDGACVPGAPPEPYYWPQYSLMLVRNANYTVR